MGAYSTSTTTSHWIPHHFTMLVKHICCVMLLRTFVELCELPRCMVLRLAFSLAGWSKSTSTCRFWRFCDSCNDDISSFFSSLIFCCCYSLSVIVFLDDLNKHISKCIRQGLHCATGPRTQLQPQSPYRIPNNSNTASKWAVYIFRTNGRSQFF